MGRSREHSSSVVLVRNLNTGAVSAQFRVIFDDHFTTVSSDYTQDNVLVPPNFKHNDQNDFIEIQRQRRNSNDAVLSKKPSKVQNIDKNEEARHQETEGANTRQTEGVLPLPLLEETRQQVEVRNDEP